MISRDNAYPRAKGSNVRPFRHPVPMDAERRPAMPMAGALIEALAAVRDHAARFPRSALDLETPDPGWSVRDVLGHVVGVTVKFAEFAEGVTDRPRTPRGDLLGSDHAGAVRAAARRSREAWATTDPARVCHLPFGTFPADTAAGINLFDLLGHGWDLEAATGIPFTVEDRLWAAGLAAARTVIGPHRDPEHYAPELPVPPGASPRVRLLAYLGREAQ